MVAHLSEVLLEVPELQTLLELLLVLCPELIEGSLGLVQLGQEPGGGEALSESVVTRAWAPSPAARRHPCHLSRPWTWDSQGQPSQRDRHLRGRAGGRSWLGLLHPHLFPGAPQRPPGATWHRAGLNVLQG